MTVITVTAVGFQEVRALSEPGRDFTMVLLAGGITGVGVWFALVTSFIVEFDPSHFRRKLEGTHVGTSERPCHPVRGLSERVGR